MISVSTVSQVLASLIAISVASVCLSGCGGGSSEDQPGSRSIESIGVAYALGGKGDQSYNDAVHNGVLALRADDIDVAEFEPTGLGDFATGVSALSARRPDLVFCVGYLYDEHIQALAQRNPQVEYVVLDGFAVGENYSAVKFDAKAGSYLAGVLAASISATGTVAFVGGTDIPIINEFRDGFSLGARSINPDVEVLTRYVGTGAAAFTDAVAGREVALAAIDQQADVVFHAAGTSGNGVIKAARERGVKAIGVDVDQSHLAPNTVAASMVKDFGTAMRVVVELAERGDPIANRSIPVGLQESAVYLGHFSNDVPDSVRGAVEAAKQAIINGEVEIP